MNSKERFYSTIHYQGYDRPPTKHYGTPEINKELMDHFGLVSHEDLQLKLGDDFRSVEPAYVGPSDRDGGYEIREEQASADGSWPGLWGERYINYSFGGGTYPEACYLPFKDMTSVEELKDYRFPTADWFDYSNIKADCEKYKDYVVYTSNAGVPDFINGTARCRGVEQVLLDIAVKDPVYLALIEQRYEFFYDMYRRVLEAGEGLIDVMCFGEDLGNQGGLMISPRAFNELFAPKMKELFALAHRYGAKTMMHSCGSCRVLIPRLIELGLDILEVVQVDAARMDITELHEQFYGKLALCGSISVQHTLPHGTEEDVIREVELRKRLYAKGGLIIAPTHDIQAGTPVKNILAMYRTIGSLQA
jgi:uroporphyrinogen decarboxylase